jgi:hypothetical protein
MPVVAEPVVLELQQDFPLLHLLITQSQLAVVVRVALVVE